MNKKKKKKKEKSGMKTKKKDNKKKTDKKFKIRKHLKQKWDEKYLGRHDCVVLIWEM